MFSISENIDLYLFLPLDCHVSNEEMAVLNQSYKYM